MQPPTFVHLRVHTEYSISDSIVRIDSLVDAAAADAAARGRDHRPRQPVRLDQDLQGGARARESSPCWAPTACVSNDAERDRPFRHAVAGAQPGRLYPAVRTVCRVPGCENEYRGRGELRAEWFDEAATTSGLIVLSGAHGGDVGQALLAGNAEAAAQLATTWAKRFPGAYYLEVQRTGADDAETHTRAAARLAARLGLPVVATHPVQFIGAGRVPRARGAGLHRRGRDPRQSAPARAASPSEQYFKSQAEMSELFADLPAALANSVEIARRCSLPMTLGKPRLPQFPTPDGHHARRLHAPARAREGCAAHGEAVPAPGTSARRTRGLPEARSTTSATRSCRWDSPATS